MEDDERGPRKEGGKRGALVDGLSRLLEKLNDLADAGEEAARSVRVDLGGKEGKEGKEGRGIQGVYGLSVRLGLPGEGLKIEPFGNIRRHDATGESVVEDVWEPLVDVFDEGDHAMIVAEMPGVDTDDIRVEVEGRTVVLSADRGRRKYHKKVDLPFECGRSDAEVSAKNGIVKIVCPRRRDV